MYPGVPIAHPDWERELAASTCRASPKSVTQTRGPLTRMLSGFTSRWMMPRSCACATARAASRTTRATSRGSPPSVSGDASTNSIAM